MKLLKHQYIWIDVINVFLAAVSFYVMYQSLCYADWKLLTLNVALAGGTIYSTRYLCKITDKISRWIYVGLLIYISVIYLTAIVAPTVAYDTWQVYDMSRYVFSDFGYMKMIRQAILNTHYEMAFPPLFPFLMQSLNLFVNLGVISSVVLNYIFSITLIVVLAKIGQRLDKARGFAVFSVLLLCSRDYIAGFRGGNTQVLGYLLLGLIAYTCCYSTEIGMTKLCICSALSALGLMNRFDFLAIGAATMIFLPFFSAMQEKDKPKRIVFKFLVTWMVFGIIISPWVIYSFLHFGKLFVTDNGRRLWNIIDTRPSTYFSSNTPALTILDDFTAWRSAFWKRCVLAINGLSTAIRAWSCVMLLTILLIGLMILSSLRKWENNQREQKTAVYYNWLRKAIACALKSPAILYLLLCILGQEILFIFTGYVETRYHVVFIALLEFILLQGIVSLAFSEKKDFSMAAIKSVTWYQGITVAVLLVAVFDVASRPYDYDKIIHKVRNAVSRDIGFRSEIVLNEPLQLIKGYLLENGCQCMAFSRYNVKLNNPRFAALSNLNTISLPENLDKANGADFVRDFEVDFVYIEDYETFNIISTCVPLTATEFEGLYRVE